MKRLAISTAAALLALSLSAPPASAQGFMSMMIRARQAEAARAANDASVVQNGERNGAGAAQVGRGNGLRIVQQGDDNAATVQQSGNNNTAGVIQRGQGHTASVSQTGDNNGACILQMGRNTSASVVQTGGERTGFVVTPRGAREMRSAQAARLCGV